MYYSMNQCKSGKSRIGVAQEHAVNIYIKIQYNIKLKSKMINIIKCNQSFKKDQKVGKYKKKLFFFVFYQSENFLSFPNKVADICALIPSMFKKIMC